MNRFFQCMMLIFFLGIGASCIGLIYAFIKKKRKRPFLSAIIATVLLLLVSAFAYHQTESPEQLAADRQRQEASRVAKEKKQAEKKQTETDKQNKTEQDATNAALQKKYDDQAEYEAWMAQVAQQEKDNANNELQKKYDDQAEYEAWVPAEIERICRNSLGSSFISVDINDDYGHYGSGKKIVLPHFIASSQNRNTILEQSGKLLCALYSEDLPISEVTTFTAKSVNGMNVAKCTLTFDRANSIDWNSIDYKNLPSYIDEYWCIPALR